MRPTSRQLLALGCVANVTTLLVESFQPVARSQPNNTPWGLGSDRRVLFFLESTKAPTSEKSDTIPADESDALKEETAHKVSIESKDADKPLDGVGAEASVAFEDKDQFTAWTIEKIDRSREEKFSMPWSDVQDSALRDKLPKYTLMIPLNNQNQEESTHVYALWRTMLKEVPELAGYPIDFLQDMQARQMNKNQTLLTVTPELLPYLEDYEFAAAGGISGKIYGVPGLADGTRIETSAVTSIEVTLPQGFIRTSDGSAAYELGRPKREEFSSVESAVKGGSSELLKNVNNAVSMVPQDVTEADGMLLRLGASSAILLAGATAVGMLSHHMTVNVFWV